MEKKVLIVDDDTKLQLLLVKYLESYGFQAVQVADSESVMKSLRVDAPDIIILDIMLGRENGLDILKEIRKQSAIPVIMLTAKGEETDRIVGLELGADDYLPKPFNPRELLARMNSVLRRSNADAVAEEEDDQPHLSSGEFRLNTDKRVLFVKNQEITLSSTEYHIIQALIRSPNRVFSRDELMNIARGKDFMAFDRSIDVHISNLRTKISKIAPDLKKNIKTVWGIGYMLEEED
ncbi:MAG: response regulator [Proteobacteria bacterium]|nr:response regulator [Pseudomonadota bacterium]